MQRIPRSSRYLEKRVSPAFLELVYPLTRPLETIDDFRRGRHEVLPELSDLDLARELSRVWRRLTFEWPKPDHWLWQRRRACFAERDRRRAAERRVA